MKTKTSMLALLLCLSCSSFALSPAGEYQISTLVQGGPVTLKSTAESIYRSGTAETEVTDTLAQVILENYLQCDN